MNMGLLLAYGFKVVSPPICFITSAALLADLYVQCSWARRKLIAMGAWRFEALASDAQKRAFPAAYCALQSRSRRKHCHHW